MMQIQQILSRLKKWHDFYGQDIVDISHVHTKEQVGECLERHREFLELQHSDAMSHLDDFKRELGLY